MGYGGQVLTLYIFFPSPVCNSWPLSRPFRTSPSECVKSEDLTPELFGPHKRNRGMARPLRLEFEGAYYHVMARGNERKPIFLEPRDYELFLRLLARAAARHGFVYHAYALMPNHYHILLETPRGELSRGLHDINTAYSRAFNDTYARVGHLFQGRFKALILDKNSYWKSVSRYIHQNPVKAGLAASPWEHPWTSCRQMLGLEPRAP